LVIGWSQDLQTVCGLLDHRFHLAGLAKMAVLKVNTLQRFLDLTHGLLKAVKPDDSLLAVAVGTSDSVALAPPLFTVAYGDLRQPMTGFFFGGNGTVSPLLEPSPHLIELLKGMETIIALLGLREDVPHPGFDPLRGVLDHDCQVQPLLLALFEHLGPVLATARLAQRQTKQVTVIEINPAQDRLSLAEQLIECPRTHSR
jgi:hypothetical protein